MAKKNRSNKHRSIRTVQLFNGKIEHGNSTVRSKPLPDPLPQAARDILVTLGAGGVAGNAMAVADRCKSDVSHWANRFVDHGALIVDESQYSKTLGLPKKDQRFGPGYPKYYTLTPYGSKLLTGSEESGRLPVVFEDMPVKFSVLKWERVGCVDWEKLGSPCNWLKFGFRVAGVRVVRTSKSVIVHPGPLMGFDVDQLEVDSGRIVERVRYILEVKFGMQLSDEVEFCHGPMWQVYRPEAREWVKEGGRVKTSEGALDASPKPWLKRLSGVAHVEFKDKRHAALASVWPPVASDPLKRNASAASMYPLYLEEVHRMVVGLVGQVEVLTADVKSVKVEQAQMKPVNAQICEVMVDLKRLADALSKLENLDKIRESLQKISGILCQLVNLEGEGASGAGAPKGSGGRDYVS